MKVDLFETHLCGGVRLNRRKEGAHARGRARERGGTWEEDLVQITGRLLPLVAFSVATSLSSIQL